MVTPQCLAVLTLFFWKSLTAKRPTKRLAKVQLEITRETSERFVTTARFGAADLYTSSKQTFTQYQISPEKFTAGISCNYESVYFATTFQANTRLTLRHMPCTQLTTTESSFYATVSQENVRLFRLWQNGLPNN